ncbi:hypothetical protein BJ875DRAFT_426244 [Amylocarpus encephaloides]|uniref:Rhodopsin domain-containing protein n=1 Tax=Amylocarpus encephaloides TaxID=45428 RepID=A0A9P7YGI9_9HELO|nr:hypothetical protein BJ875DRAFT_426244 [Amylocarpus encephaloides]
MASSDSPMFFMGQPPPGVKSNPIDPPSLEALSQALFSILLAINISFVLCRLAFKITSGFTIDDVFIILASLLGNAQTILILTLTRWARHGWDIPMTWFDATYMKKMLYAQTMLAYGSLLFTKISILLLYLRIFTIKRIIRQIIYFGIVWSVLTYSPFVVTASWYCAPHVGEEWNMTVALRCRHFDYWQIASSAMAIMLDVFILVLPMPLLRELQLSKSKKMGVIVVFSTASFALICAILTMVYRIKLRKSEDPFWTTWEATITNIAENNVAIIVACVPGTFSFCKKFIVPSRLSMNLKSLISRTTTSNSKNSAPRKDSAGSSGMTSYGGSSYSSPRSTEFSKGYEELKYDPENPTRETVTDVRSLPKVATRNGLEWNGGRGTTRELGIEQRYTHIPI